MNEMIRMSVFLKLNDVRYLEAQGFKNNICRVLNRLVLAAVVYYIWQERTLRCLYRSIEMRWICAMLLWIM